MPGDAQFRLAEASFSAPSGWSAKMVVLVGPPEEPATGYRKNVVFSRETLDEGVSAAAYVDAQLALMKQHMEGFQCVKRETIDLAGVEAPLFEIRSIGPQGALFAGFVAIRVDGRTAYNLSGSHFAGEVFDGARSEFLRIFQSLALQEIER